MSLDVPAISWGTLIGVVVAVIIDSLLLLLFLFVAVGGPVSTTMLPRKVKSLVRARVQAGVRTLGPPKRNNHITGTNGNITARMIMNTLLLIMFATLMNMPNKIRTYPP